MTRWASYFWRAMTALGEADPMLDYWYPVSAEEAAQRRQFRVDLSKDTSVRAAFRSIVEWEWGPAAFGNEKHP